MMLVGKDDKIEYNTLFTRIELLVESKELNIFRGIYA